MTLTTATTGNRTEPELRQSARELSAGELRFSSKIAGKFASTRELTGAKEFVGQERALAALSSAWAWRGAAIIFLFRA
jgi:hypothetical protein